MHTWQIQAPFLVLGCSNGKGLGRIGNGIHPFAKHPAPVVHGRLILQALFAERGHVDHLLQHFLGEHPGLTVDNLHHIAVFRNQVRQRLTTDRRGIVSRIKRGFFQRQGGQILLHGQVILEIGLLLAFLHLVERWLGNVDVTPFNQFRHLTEEER